MTMLDYSDLIAAQGQVLALLNQEPEQTASQVATLLPELVSVAENANPLEKENALKIADTFGIALLAAKKNVAPEQAEDLNKIIKTLSDLLKKSEPTVISVMIRLEGNPTMTLDFIRNNQDFSRLHTASIFEDVNRQLMALQIFDPQSLKIPAV